MYKIENVANVKVLFEKNSSNIVNIQILTDIGSSDENKDSYGVAHFLEHMFFKGTIKRDAKAINHDADILGAKINAWTWHDHTNYHLTVMKENFEAGFELLSDIYQNAVFPEDELNKERTVILSEIRRYEDDPPSMLSDIALNYFCENGLAHPVIGNTESVSKLTRDDLITFRNNYYGGNNVLISVVGGIDFDEVKNVIVKYFKNTSSNSPNPLSIGKYRSGFITHNKTEIQESQYQLYYPAYPFLHEKSALSHVMSSVLGGNASSFLFERIREELGLCYGIYSRISNFEGFNYLEIYTGCAAKDIDFLHDEVMKIINNMKTKKISEDRLKMVKSSMLSSIYMGIESSGGLNSYLSLGYMKGLRDDFLNKKIEEIKAITVNQIKDISNEIFSKEPLIAKLLPTE